MTRYLLILLLLPLTGWSSSRMLSSEDLPYSLTTAQHNNYDTILVSSKITSSTNGISITAVGAVDDTVYLIISDTLGFNTGNGNDYYGIYIAGAARYVKIVGLDSNGCIYNSSSTGTDCECIKLGGADNILVEHLNLYGDGENGKCVMGATGASPAGYNVTFEGGYWANACESYTSRCNYDGAVLNLNHMFYDVTRDSADFRYHCRIHGVRVTEAHSQGIFLGSHIGADRANLQIVSCTLTSDARNTKYESGDVTCHSAANPYCISLNRPGCGSKIAHNLIRSDSTYGGSRGIIIEMATGADTNRVQVCSNYVDVHEGPNLEVVNGLVQVLRIRYGNSYLHVYDNTFIGTGDTSSSTSSYGLGVATFRFTPNDEEGQIPGHDNLIENNLFRAACNDSGVISRAFIYESVDSCDGNIIRYNRFESCHWILQLGGTNGGCKSVTLERDTFVFLDSYDDAWTIVAGYNWGDYYAKDDTLLDCVFEGGASDTNIYFRKDGSDVLWMRTVEITVNGNNSQIVPGASVWVIDNYGDTVLTGTTDSCGLDSVVATYWWEYHDGADSTGYNDFTVKAKKGTDSSSTTYTVSDTTNTPSLTLSATAGDNGGCALNDKFVEIRGTRFIGGQIK